MTDRMSFRSLWTTFAGLVAFSGFFFSEVIAAEQVVDYSRDIRPILARNCFACHGPDQGTLEAGLRLDRRDDALLELESGERAIVSGSPDESELVARIISTDSSLVMPPKETGKTLSPHEIELLKRWIQQGAPYARHWSFEPIVAPVVPNVRPESFSNWPRNEIDHFVFDRLNKEGLEPSPEADPLTLVRRLSLDLTGLPPSEEDIRTYLRETRPDAYERLVDRLLQSPHFGERWGRHWLDLARYADSNGYLGDELRGDAYRYRDWVIDAINNDQPYDQFTIEQIAGDLLNGATTQQQIATGFHRNSMKNTEAGADRELDRVVQAVDRLSTVGTVWLGLTVACAECHSHKFDPISHHEFYALYAFFNNLEEANIKLGEQIPPAASPEEQLAHQKELAKIAASLEQNKSIMAATGEQSLNQYLSILAQAPVSRAEPDREALDHWLADLDNDGKKLVQKYETAAQKLTAPKPILAPGISERTSKPRQTFVHLRGDFRQPGDNVSPGTPDFLPPLSPRSDVADRLDLANWIVRRDHPLTSRTAVNHVWKHLFGRGLVETADNFGATGSEPSHPELLNWLALRLMDSGWSRKELIRTIVLSATYRQSSSQSKELSERDPQNVLVARQGRFRLEGEIIRDVALSASGLLNSKIGGPSIRPPLNSRITEVSRNREWKVSPGAEKYRRGMYILFRRATPYPMLTIFDSPDSTVSCPDRERSNSPLQALTLLNDPVFFECAQHLGRELAGQGVLPDDQWIPIAFERVLSRPVEPGELGRLMQVAQQLRQLLQEAPIAEIQDVTGELQQGIDPREQVVRVLVVRSLLNLDEFITRE